MHLEPVRKITPVSRNEERRPKSAGWKAAHAGRVSSTGKVGPRGEAMKAILASLGMAFGVLSSASFAQEVEWKAAKPSPLLDRPAPRPPATGDNAVKPAKADDETPKE